MADARTYFVLSDDNCKFESMTKEQILTAIEQAVSEGKIVDVDTGFVTTIKEQNANAAFKIWVGTQAQYNALAEKASDCLYIISNDTSKRDVENAIQILRSEVNALYDGSAPLGYAKKAETVDGYYKTLDDFKIDLTAASVADILKLMTNDSFLVYGTSLKLDNIHYDSGTWHGLYRRSMLHATLLSISETKIQRIYYKYNFTSKAWELNKISEVAMTEVAL